MFDIYENDVIDNNGNKLDLSKLKQQMIDIENAMLAVDDSIFPDFLYVPMENEFEDDDYKSRGIIKDSISQKVRQLRRKYGNYVRYIEAIEIYEEYKETLKEKYGSMKFAKSGIKAGLFPEMYVVKPKIKMGKLNKQLLSLEVAISKSIDNLENEFDGAFINNAPPVSENYVDDDEFYDMTKPPKVLDEEFENQRRRARRRNLSIRYRGSADIDSIVDFVNRGGSVTYNEFGERVNDDYESLVAMAKKEDEESYRDPNIVALEEYENSPYVEFGRVMKDRSESMIIEVMAEMYREGFNIHNRGNIGERGKKMLRNKLNSMGIDESIAMTKKEKKKLKKKHKKWKKLMEKEMGSDSRLESIMANNRITMSFNRDDFDRLKGDL